MHCARFICCDQTGKGKQESIVPNARGKKWVATDVGSACTAIANILLFLLFLLRRFALFEFLVKQLPGNLHFMIRSLLFPNTKKMSDGRGALKLKKPIAGIDKKKYTLCLLPPLSLP